ncbi:unnamed protein product [Rotaria sp. Silwood2]|nr:unnamed protein product [Rotaria sp. Silwood2]
MVSHSAYYACRVCEMEGTYNELDNTCTYPWYIFEHTNPRFRTRKNFEKCLQEVDHLKSMGRKKINVRGIKDVSPLNQLIFMPSQTLYDYFHLCLEGHTRALIKAWNDIHGGTSLETLQVINKFDEFLSSINYPHSLHRKVKDFRRFNNWKASQLRLFLLYLALPFLLFFSCYFPPLLVYHFSLFSIYIRTLCKFDDRQHVYDVRPFIENHLRRFSEFYESKELLSTHCQYHLWEQVVRHGSLSATRYD